MRTLCKYPCAQPLIVVSLSSADVVVQKLSTSSSNFGRLSTTPWNQKNAIPLLLRDFSKRTLTMHFHLSQKACSATV